jgi:hypothetical protein
MLISACRPANATLSSAEIAGERPTAPESFHENLADAGMLARQPRLLIRLTKLPPDPVGTCQAGGCRIGIRGRP